MKEKFFYKKNFSSVSILCPIEKSKINTYKFISFYFIQSVLYIYLSTIYFILFYYIQSELYIYISTIYFILLYPI